MRLRYLGHSGIQLRDGEHEVVVDPFITNNGPTPVGLDELEPETIVLSHAHGDHYGDTPALAERSGATVVSSAEIAGYVGQRGMKGHGMNIGGHHAFAFGRVGFTPAWHSSSFPDGTYGGMPMGILLDMGGLRIYHAGDTALFSDMRLIGRKGLDIALVPIGDNFTMGPDDALEAVKLLAPKRVIPVHYNTFPVIEQDANAFKARVEQETDAECLVLQPGDGLEL
jgi:L-ascorbate metabolism protein UlaG (beta-lactamase superfamily)